MSFQQNGSACRLAWRERRRLLRAREMGYLDATCADSAGIVKEHGLWCWRLKLPLVRFERCTPRSRYGRVRLEMFTTPNVLTPTGQAAMRALTEATYPGMCASMTPHDAQWDRVLRKDLDKLAGAVLRAAIRVGNYQRNRPKVMAIAARRPATSLGLAASA